MSSWISLRFHWTYEKSLYQRLLKSGIKKVLTSVILLKKGEDSIQDYITIKIHVTNKSEFSFSHCNQNQLSLNAHVLQHHHKNHHQEKEQGDEESAVEFSLELKAFVHNPCSYTWNYNGLNIYNISICYSVSIPEEPENFDGYLTDMKVQCQNRSYDCHKLILSAKSPVFESLLKNNNESVIHIKDFEANIVRAMMNYIYTELISQNISAIRNGLTDLYRIAEKYNIEKLIRECDIKLSRELTPDNLLEMCQFVQSSDMQDSKLRGGIVRFISNRMDEIVKTNYWREIKKNHGDIIVDAMALKFQYDLPQSD